MKIACLQTIVPHYREEFFNLIKKEYPFRVYIFNENIGGGFNKSLFPTKTLKTRRLWKFLLFDFKQLLDDRNDIVIFPFQAKTTISCLHLLLLSKIYGFKVILWGQGISVVRYLKEERKTNPLLKIQLRFADGCWVYMDKEAEQWKRIFPRKPIKALHNTISGADEIMKLEISNKENLKKKYGINEKRIVIYCARCTYQRRFDLFISVIKQMIDKSIGFIIIGEGPAKPNFKSMPHVYDFGAVYDESMKRELFDIADVYFQPGWVGLSIVEAMLYGKPVLTFRRTADILQCVEYSYIKGHVNGEIFDRIDDVCFWLQTKTGEEIRQLGEKTRMFARQNLSMKSMVSNACSIIELLK